MLDWVEFDAWQKQNNLYCTYINYAFLVLYVLNVIIIVIVIEIVIG